MVVVEVIVYVQLQWDWLGLVVGFLLVFGELGLQCIGEQVDVVEVVGEIGFVEIWGMFQVECQVQCFVGKQVWVVGVYLVVGVIQV